MRPRARTLGCRLIVSCPWVVHLPLLSLTFLRLKASASPDTVVEKTFFKIAKVKMLSKPKNRKDCHLGHETSFA